MTKENLLQHLQECCDRLFGCSLEMATEKQVYRAVCVAVRELLEDDRRAFVEQTRAEQRKQVYYMSMEFLVGTSLRNNLYNMGLLEPAGEILHDLGFSLESLCALEPDAGLGNGGLGRLASCYMDAATGLNYPVTGFSIRYEFGIFRQKIVDGWQMEFPDNWLEMGDVWLHTRKDDAVEVRFGGQVHEWMDGDKFKTAQTGYQSVIAVPHDLYISGYGSKAVNKLTLWSASMPQSFDMNAFSRGDYVRALEQNTMAEAISKVLYPADDHINGKRLRLRQQYLLVSSSLQSILNEHLKNYHTLDNLADKVAVHINDTHPAMVIPELMRILMDENDMSWEQAWNITSQSVAYTNHTVMPEALECWPESLVQELMPRVMQIIHEINERFCKELWNYFPGDFQKISKLAIVADGRVRMAHLAIAGSFSINGVSALHSEILKERVFNDFYKIYSSKFCNVTNGIAHRRWLCEANPELAELIESKIGTGYRTHPSELQVLANYAGDKELLNKLGEIKRHNKQRLADYIKAHNGIEVSMDSIFDVQVKRLHEYKRQHMNALHILSVYQWLLENPNADYTPHTFFFGAKAAPGYYFAKEILQFIVCLADTINNDPRVNQKLRVIFVENYCVSWAELLTPAAEISEQISLAGTEASGTSNMKFMINGAITLGTLDGANVEIHDAVGDDNIILFGMTTPEVNSLRASGYNPRNQYEHNDIIRKAMDALGQGFNGKTFQNLHQALLNVDQYMALADFASYSHAQQKAEQLYRDQTKWNSMSLVNTAKAGIFAADRAIRDYANTIWLAKPVETKAETKKK